ncbi:MAG: hypothetical protein WA715_27450 [Candidatus Acidiferrum sp.]
MKNRLGFIKTTLVWGIVFLIPAVIVVIALGKLIGALKVMAKALSHFFGIESLAGGLALDLLAFAVTILLCFVGDACQAYNRQTHAGETRRHFVELFPRVRLH